MPRGQKTGGRKTGTPNKITTVQRSLINDLLCNYYITGQMSDDFNMLEPKDRLNIAEKLFAYVLPKYQSIALDVKATDGTKTLEQRLVELSKENDID